MQLEAQSGMVAYACNSSTQEAEAGKLQTQVQLELKRKEKFASSNKYSIFLFFQFI
jgi:hypothetical protein